MVCRSKHWLCRAFHKSSSTRNKPEDKFESDRGLLVLHDYNMEFNGYINFDTAGNNKYELKNKWPSSFDYKWKNQRS